MTTSGADSSSSEGKSLFRLLTLIRETQCEVEVVKPILDELEVMRLCRSFGMMSLVNPKDFDFDILDAREFDEDFTRFLQSDLLENKCQDKVRFKGLFGKRAQVLATLVDMKVCSADILASLTELGEGVYCVKIAVDSCSDSSRDDTAKVDVGLVVFSWLRDELFEPQQLRDTTTLVLRFLTVLTPDIICCTSTSDLEQLRAAMVDSGKQQDESLSSYSVFFAIEKQVDAVDGTKCVAQKAVDLKDIMKGCLRVCLLKGNYPALVLTKTVESKLHVEQFQQKFSASARLKFAAWLKDESRQHRVELSGTIIKSAALTETILREFDMWPAMQIAAVSEARKKSDQDEYEMANRRLDEEIARQRSVVRRLSSVLFQLDPGNMKGKSVEKEQTVAEYEAFRKWLKTKWKADRKLQLNLDIPTRLREVERAVFELHSHNQDADLETVLGMCSTSTKEQLLRAVAERRSPQLPSDSNTKNADTDIFGENIVGPLSKLQKQWLSAIESCLTMVKIDGLKLLTNEEKRKLELDASSAPIIQNQFEQLRQMLQSTHGLTMKVSVTMRKRDIICKGTKEIQATDCVVEQLVRIEMGSCESSGTTIGLETLGQYFLKPGETHVAIFTIKTRSAVHVCTSLGRMLIKLVHFPPRNGARQVPQATDTIIYTLGKIASVCDYDCQSRTLAFLAGDSVGLYKCDENFKRMEVIKVIDLNVRSTLSDLPFTDVFLLKNIVYMTDSSGYSQGIDVHTDQINTAVSVDNNPDQDARSCSRLMSFADNLAAGVVIVKPAVGAKFEAELRCVSLDDDHRHLPVLPLGVELLTQDLQVQCIGGWLLAVDAAAQKLHLFSVDITVESNSFRLRQFDDDEKENVEDGSELVRTESLRKQHWLYTFYHVFEKFPVLGLLEDGPQKPVTILATCSVGKNLGIALEDFHDFLSLLMSDLMALNKPLNRLNLTEGLGVRHAALAGVRMESMPLSEFFMKLVTFLPVQICRAEANTLTLLQDGMDEPHDEAEVGMDESSWGTAAIAESIRFGLLSPLLSAWQGRCVVVTSMGKQSTGKSYFLNHLTGSSFAIAGNRCTDGAWMTLRIMKGVLLVVLDFEGLGSFERTDQEDVFLAVLNASLSMFTIFRMEMRIDKEVDDLFKKFQKGVNLLKNDSRLFQGKLYMSVKDTNLNDGGSVLSEFKKKIGKLLTANPEQNFLTDMYSGKVNINCSPPLGTDGYYSSLRHAKQLVQKVICSQKDSPNAYRSGDSFHDCIRLVLAKVSTLDWTTVDDTLQQLQTKNLLRRLPGVIRTGCLIPADWYTKDSVSKCLAQPAVSTEKENALLRFDILVQDYPEWLQCWPDAGTELAFDSIEDASIDFGPSVCDFNGEGIRFVLVELFQRYLDLSFKEATEKITADDFAHFDVLLSFLVHRRKHKVALWMKEYLGPDQFMDAWIEIEQSYLAPFEALLQRCIHRCAKCQLQCMRSTLHISDKEHDCGMNHECRGSCEYCVLSRVQDKDEIPHCVGRAGHEGKCKCGKGDHTCGSVCGLSTAPNCEVDCELEAGHDGDHRCAVKRHTCGVACSATNCRGKCCLSVERCHGVHKCRETRCNHPCEMKGCKRDCSTANHFHGDSSLTAEFARENKPFFSFYPRRGVEGGRHMCGSSHTCNKPCEEAGICSTVIRVSPDRFNGKRDTFDYISKVMVGVRNKCAIVLEPGQTDHEEELHSCVKRSFGARTDVHGCTEVCEACEYFCDKPVGHGGKHSTAHGNMRNMRFVSKDATIEWDDHKYAPGDKAVAEMCNLYCSTAGRGHVHYLNCSYESADRCVYSGMHDCRRHCNSSLLEPQPSGELDEVLHAEYWETIGWKDPCHSASERALFAKCPYVCNSIEHKGNGEKTSGCDLPAWHDPVTTDAYVVLNGISYINGHRFNCSHPSADIFHHIFVLDCSGSMKGGPWNALVKGVHDYLSNQMASGRKQDTVSAVTFGDDGRIVYEREKIANAVTRYVDFRGGGTYYAKGLKAASAIISRTNRSMYRPVVVFFTDGRPADAKQGLRLAKDMRHRYGISGLRVFVVGYGKKSEDGLQVLSDHLGGSVHKASSLEGLVDTFRSISTSLGARTGLICSKSKYA